MTYYVRSLLMNSMLRQAIRRKLKGKQDVNSAIVRRSVNVCVRW